MSTDCTSFVPFWLDEKDWLCTVELLPEYDDEERANVAEVIGYLFGYAQMTDTRMLALVGDGLGDTYELLFSFSSQENKRQFLSLVRSNEITRTENDRFVIPDDDRVRDARPLALVLPADVLQHVVVIGTTLVAETEWYRPN